MNNNEKAGKIVSSTQDPAEFAREYEEFWTDEEEDEEEAK